MKRLTATMTVSILSLVLVPGLAAQAPAGEDSAATEPAEVASSSPAAEAEDAGGVTSLRATLRQRLDSLEARREATEDGAERERIAEEIDALRHRLMMGDFAPGQTVRLEVSEMQRWSGEFTVGPDRTLELPGIEPISLKGALRPEAPERVAEALGDYIRDPEVEVESTRRIAVLGAVTNPGFYHFSGEVTVSEAIMTAGGPTQEAVMEDFTLERDGSPITDGSAFRMQGRTLEELGLRSGDVVKVPADDGDGVRSWLMAAGSLGSVLGVALAIF